jgi:hypothetical protein
MRRLVHLAASLVLMLTASADFTAAHAASAAQAPAQESAQPANAYEAAEAFLRHLRKGDFAKAYAMAAPELKGTVSAEEFAKQVGMFKKAGIQTVRWQNLKVNIQLIDFYPGKGWRWNVTNNLFQGYLTTSNGGDTIVHFSWVNEDGTWRMLGFRWDEVAKTSQAN